MLTSFISSYNPRRIWRGLNLVAASVMLLGVAVLSHTVQAQDTVIDGSGFQTIVFNDQMHGTIVVNVDTTGEGALTLDFSGLSTGINLDLTTGFDENVYSDVAVRINLNPIPPSPNWVYRVIGSQHADRVVGSPFADHLFGGAGDDSISAGEGSNLIDGQSGNDLLIGGNEGDRIWDSDGDDTVKALGGDDEIRPGNGNNAFDLGDGNDFFVLVDSSGIVGTNRIVGGNGYDEIDLSTLDNTIDIVHGEAGDDTIRGGGQNDSLRGGPGDDLIEGGSGDDTVLGDDNTDVVSGGDGNDTIDGGRGSDTRTITASTECAGLDSLTFIENDQCGGI